MSDSDEPAVQCTVCDAQGALLCVQCRSARYCSKDCQRIDWPTHKLLCRSFSDFRVGPGPRYRRAILFPVHENAPKFIWVEVERVFDDVEGTSDELVRLGGLLGAEKPGSGWLYAQFNCFRNRELEDTIAIVFRDAFMIDGSLPNKSISKATRGEHEHVWAGPIIAFRKKGVSFYSAGFMTDCGDFLDITLGDFRHVVDFLVTYCNDSYQNTSLTSATKVKGVRISCESDQAILGTQKYVPIEVEDCSEIFRMHKPIRISELIELPIFVRKCRPDLAWKNDPRADYSNQAATFLHLDLDPKSSAFGWAPHEWDERVGSVLAMRADRKALSPHHMEALCQFCQFTMGPWIDESLGGGLVKRTRDDVMRRLTKETFQEFFRAYKAKQNGPSWAATECPYVV